MEPLPSLWIDYTNHRGERAWREIRPLAVRFGSSEWHPAQQYLLGAWDVEKGAERTFAMKDIHAISDQKMVSFYGGWVRCHTNEPQKMDWDWTDVPQEGQPAIAPTPLPVWKIESPDGRVFQGTTFLAAMEAKTAATVPPAVALDRVLKGCAWTESDEKELQDHMRLVKTAIRAWIGHSGYLAALDTIEVSARKLMGYPGTGTPAPETLQLQALKPQGSTLPGPTV